MLASGDVPGVESHRFPGGFGDDQQAIAAAGFAILDAMGCVVGEPILVR